jgi:hypothetical protein
MRVGRVAYIGTMRRGSLWLLVVLLPGCGGGLERVSFGTDLLSYQPGARVGLSLVNTSATPLGINLCLSRVVSDDGATAGPVDQETCVLEPVSLDPGQRLDTRKTLPPTITPGTWRYETTIRLARGAGEKVLTPAFTVTAP